MWTTAWDQCQGLDTVSATDSITQSTSFDDLDSMRIISNNNNNSSEYEQTLKYKYVIIKGTCTCTCI